MEDKEIIALYHARNEQAIRETQNKYGALCHRIALNILGIREDAEECVNDTYHAAWNRMPPDAPSALKVFLGRITRNLSISRYRTNHAQKRYVEMEIMLSELEDCIPSPDTVEQLSDRNRLAELISLWLGVLPKEDRILFVRRYWYGDSSKALASDYGYRENQMAQKMLKLRKSLKTYLESEGVSL